MRIASSITAQELDGEGVVLADESTGAEITLDIPTARRLAGALHHLVPGGITDAPVPGGGHLEVRVPGDWARRRATRSDSWEDVGPVTFHDRDGNVMSTGRVSIAPVGDQVFQSGRHNADGTSEPGEFLPAAPPRRTIVDYLLGIDVNRRIYDDGGGEGTSCAATGKRSAEDLTTFGCTAGPGHLGDHEWNYPGVELTICGGTWRGFASTDATPSLPQPCGLGLGHEGPTHGPAPRQEVQA